MANDQLLEEHRQTWKGFVRLVVFSAGAVVITLALMAIFLL
jgi:Ni,Fe-hydrogenase I cytochrome b subunit